MRFPGGLARTSLAERDRQAAHLHVTKDLFAGRIVKLDGAGRAP